MQSSATQMTLHVGRRFKFASIFGFQLAVYPLELGLFSQSQFTKIQIHSKAHVTAQNLLDAAASSLGHADRRAGAKSQPHIQLPSPEGGQGAGPGERGGNQPVNTLFAISGHLLPRKAMRTSLSRSLQLCDRDSKDPNWLLAFGKALLLTALVRVCVFVKTIFPTAVNLVL